MGRHAKQPREGGRRSIRCQQHDYSSAGFYFITVCTPNRYRYFAEIAPDGVRLRRAGRIVATCWDELPLHFPRLTIDTFVVMPDHIHGILVLETSTGWRAPGGTAVLPGSLGAVVRSFKAAATRRIRLVHPAHPPVWQRNYYERVLRDQHAVHCVRQYIVNNPAKLFDRVVRAGGWSCRTRGGGARPGG